MQRYQIDEDRAFHFSHSPILDQQLKLRVCRRVEVVSTANQQFRSSPRGAHRLPCAVAG